MNKFVQKYRLQPGDEVVLPKSIFNLVQHYALYIGKNQYGVESFIENKIGQGVVLTSADDFFPADGSITRINRFSGTAIQREKVIQKAKSLIGRPYNAFLFNCEHLTTQVRTGKAKSRQVEHFGWLLAGILIVRYLLFQNSSETNSYAKVKR